MTHPADILMAAAKLIENGWCQKEYTDPDDNYCMLGAIMKSARDGLHAWNYKNDIVADFVTSVIANDDHHDCEVSPLVQWNDAPGRTQAEVADALRCAASLAMDGAA